MFGERWKALDGYPQFVEGDAHRGEGLSGAT
jgi:hypothetical protein